MQDKANTVAVGTQNQSSSVKLKMDFPDIKEMLAAGVQFGHQTQKWNPKMSQFIFGAKNNIHIIDLIKTEEKLKEAAEYLFQQAQKGNILFVGTKRQVAEIVKDAAVESGSFFVTHRWPGGLLSNFRQIQKSLKRLNQLEVDFKKGIVNRTKFEVNKMKKEWEKMNRLYEGVKLMERFPTAIVVVDSKYERNALKEAKLMRIPVISLVDTNCDPDSVNYPVPANDDAIKSVTLLIGALARSVRQGNLGRGVKHEFVDYSTYEVQVIKKETPIESISEKEMVGSTTNTFVAKKVEAPSSSFGKKNKVKGILETIQENKVNETTKKVEKKSEKKVEKKVEVKPAVKKPVKKVVKKAK